MADDTLHEKLRKILALTNSPVEGEAAAASAMLSKFLTKYNLSIADLELKGASRPGVKEHGVDLGKAAFKWKLDLAEGIAEFYYCAPMVNKTYKTVKFIGRPDNVEALQMLYTWVIDQIKVIARDERRKHYDRTGEHIDPLRWQLGFGIGAVDRLVERLKEMKAREAEDMSHDEFGNVTALAVHHQSEVSDYLEKEYGYRTDGKETESDRKRRQYYDNLTAEWDRKAREQEYLKSECERLGDMEPYYTAYPDQRPEVIAKAEEERSERMRKWEKEEAARERRRKGPAYRPVRESPADLVKEEQQQKAQQSGSDNAHKVNLRPFVDDGKKPSKGAIDVSSN